MSDSCQLRFRISALLLAICGLGCWHLPSGVPGAAWSQIDTIHVIPPARVSEAEVSDIVSGKGEGALIGASRAATALLAECGGDSAIVCLILIPPALLAGGIYGAIKADDAATVAEQVDAIDKTLAASLFHSVLHDQVMEYLRSTSGLQVMELPADSVSTLQTQGDSILQLDVARLELSEFGGGLIPESFLLELDLRAQLTLNSDGTTLFDHTFERRQGPHPLDHWAAQGGRALRESLDEAIEDLAQLVVDQIFVAPDVIIEAIEPKPAVLSNWMGRPPRTASLHPTLRWTIAGLPEHAESLEYEVRIYSTRATIGHPFDRLVEKATGVKESYYAPQVPLEGCRQYAWTVRGHWREESRRRLTRWAYIHAVGAEFLPVFRADSGPALSAEFYFHFRTPCQATPTSTAPVGRVRVLLRPATTSSRYAGERRSLAPEVSLARHLPGSRWTDAADPGAACRDYARRETRVAAPRSRTEAPGAVRDVSAIKVGPRGFARDECAQLALDRLMATERLLREYIEYYNTERVHTSIGDAPEGRLAEHRPSERAKVVGLPRVGGLHHRYTWIEAA